MNEEIKALWIDALRYGEYKQGTGNLRRMGEGGKDQYCCLGVLCDLYAKSEENSADPQGPIEWKAPEPHATAYRIGRRAHYLPGSVMGWAGLITPEGRFINDEGWGDDLTELNDEGWTFEEIANVIEQKF